jgi:hypothetical protein
LTDKGINPKLRLRKNNGDKRRERVDQRGFGGLHVLKSPKFERVCNENIDKRKQKKIRDVPFANINLGGGFKVR